MTNYSSRLYPHKAVGVEDELLHAGSSAVSEADLDELPKTVLPVSRTFDEDAGQIQRCQPPDGRTDDGHLHASGGTRDRSLKRPGIDVDAGANVFCQRPERPRDVPLVIE